MGEVIGISGKAKDGTVEELASCVFVFELPSPELPLASPPPLFAARSASSFFFFSSSFRWYSSCSSKESRIASIIIN